MDAEVGQFTLNSEEEVRSDIRVVNQPVMIEEFLRQYKNQKLLEALNEAYREELDVEEQQELEQWRQYQGCLLRQEESHNAFSHCRFTDSGRMLVEG